LPTLRCCLPLQIRALESVNKVMESMRSHSDIPKRGRKYTFRFYDPLIV
jgi:hypothetical protein